MKLYLLYIIVLTLYLAEPKVTPKAKLKNTEDIFDEEAVRRLEEKNPTPEPVFTSVYEKLYKNKDSKKSCTY